MTAGEAYTIAKKNFKHSFTNALISNYRDSFIFCFGDLENWVSVNKVTGKVKNINRVGLIFENIDNEEFCNELNNAVINAKPVSELES